MSRKILHLDLDAFYPSVEVLDDPDLAGKPVIVGGLGPRGVVASASYEARAFGVHSALPMAVARRRCPEGCYLRPRFSRYRELSGLVFEVYREWTDLVQPLSLDEAYLDVSERPENGVEIATIVRQQVRSRTGLTVSAGVASNKFLAKLASDHDKPDGLTAIPDADAVGFLAPLDVDRIWGIGPSTAARLRKAGLPSIGDL
ncbi:MAG TPA: DNA polymerase IV, partial [Acidobacteriota bacterium]|nr:DNA polymerase IV [Acidobacteriota bacterium]